MTNTQATIAAAKRIASRVKPWPLRSAGCTERGARATARPRRAARAPTVRPLRRHDTPNGRRTCSAPEWIAARRSVPRAGRGSRTTASARAPGWSWPISSPRPSSAAALRVYMRSASATPMRCSAANVAPLRQAPAHGGIDRGDDVEAHDRRIRAADQRDPGVEHLPIAVVREPARQSGLQDPFAGGGELGRLHHGDDAASRPPAGRSSLVDEEEVVDAPRAARRRRARRRHASA